MRSRIAILTFATVVGACANPGAEEAFTAPFQLPDHEWEEVFDDERYTVSIDLAHVSPGPVEDSVEVWYETLHKASRQYEGRAWNREVIRSQVRCEPVSFRTVLTTIFLDHSPPIAQVGPTAEELPSLEWRQAGIGSVDEAAFTATCQLLREHGLLGPQV